MGDGRPYERQLDTWSSWYLRGVLPVMRLNTREKCEESKNPRATATSVTVRPDLSITFASDILWEVMYCWIVLPVSALNFFWMADGLKWNASAISCAREGGSHSGRYIG